MSKTKILTILSISMVIINAALLTFIFWKPHHGHHPHPRHHGPRDIIIQKLDLNEEQIVLYDNMIKLHKEAIEKDDEKIRALKSKLYQNLGEGGDQSNEEGLLTQLSRTQQDIERLHLQHFKQLKALCKGNQVEKFNALTKELAKLFAPKPMPPRKNRP